LNSSLDYWSPEWAGGGTIREIKVGENGILTVSVVQYNMETTFPNTNITDFGAQVSVSCIHEGSEIHASFELESFEVVPSP
jgi:hypothetical protein